MGRSRCYPSVPNADTTPSPYTSTAPSKNVSVEALKKHHYD
ncbi:hypothetical protein OAT73_03020 [Candidatus Poseidoniaceae archaeon]|nr:hypothetical protein [Candidatus Poseidoniaceae archaeon]